MRGLFETNRKEKNKKKDSVLTDRNLIKTYIKTHPRKKSKRAFFPIVT